MKTLVVGLGNPILGDDGIGWSVAKKVLSYQKNYTPTKEPSMSVYKSNQISFDVEFLSSGGLRLMEELIDYDQAIIIDALNTGQYPPGYVSVFNLDEINQYLTGHLVSSHDTSLWTAIELGRALGANLPGEIKVVGIESKNLYSFSEDLTPEVEKAILKASLQVLELINLEIPKDVCYDLDT